MLNKTISVGCGILVFLFLYGCAATDHSRNFPQNITVEPFGILCMQIEVLVEKEGTETSSAETKTDGKLDATVTPLP